MYRAASLGRAAYVMCDTTCTLNGSSSCSVSSNGSHFVTAI